MSARTLPFERSTHSSTFATNGSINCSRLTGRAGGPAFFSRASGQRADHRLDSAAEIAGQVVAMLNAHGHRPPEPVNLVFMGIGTLAFNNLGGIGQCPDVDAVWQALQECMA